MMMSNMIEPRCLSIGKLGRLYFRTFSSAWENGFMAPRRRGCIRTRRGEGGGSRPAAFIIHAHKRRSEPMPARRVGKDRPHGMISQRLVLAALCISAYASMACAPTQLNLDSLKRLL